MSSDRTSGDTYVLNGIPADISGFVPDMSADIYYEVVRLIDGKLLFLKDHLDRLERSLTGSAISFPGKELIMDHLGVLLKHNSLTRGNIRICLQSARGKGADLYCYFIPYVYPDPKMYKEGVVLKSYPHTRPNPGIKKWDDRFRRSVGQFIREQGIYEAVLLNPDQQITEGSRSNLFFIDRDHRLVTAPEHMILPGITRKYVFDIARTHGIRIIEEAVALASAGSYLSAFISGTSPKVLPVRQLDEYRFEVAHPVLQLLMKEFEVIMQKNLTTV